MLQPDRLSQVWLNTTKSNEHYHGIPLLIGVAQELVIELVKILEQIDMEMRDCRERD